MTSTQTRGAPKSKRTLELARCALRDLNARGAAISFQAVARQAGISRQWLYTQPELRDEIQRLRAQSFQQGTEGVPACERASQASLRQRVESLLEENQRLRHDNSELREELALAYGRQRESSGLAPTATD